MNFASRVHEKVLARALPAIKADLALIVATASWTNLSNHPSTGDINTDEKYTVPVKDFTTKTSI